MRREENSNRSSFCLGTYQFKRPSATSDANSEFDPRLTIESGLSRYSDFHSLGVRMGVHTTICCGPGSPRDSSSGRFLSSPVLS